MSFFYNPEALIDFIMALLIVISLFVFQKTLLNIIAKKLITKNKSDSNQSSNRQQQSKIFIDAVSSPINLIMAVIGLNVLKYLMPQLPGLTKTITLVTSEVGHSIVMFALFWLAYRLINNFSKPLNSVMIHAGIVGKNELRMFILSCLKTLIVIIGMISVLQSFGIQITAVLGTAGIATMAIGFAAKDALSNILGSIAIFLDKTFDTGDWIETSSVDGTVERIGLRTTAIRKFDKSLAIVPNGILANTAITNYSRMTNRRTVWNISIDCHATAQQLLQIRDEIKKYLYEHLEIETDPKKVTTLVCYKGFNEHGIHLLCYFFTKTTNWSDFMDRQEECLLKIKEIIENAGTKLAYSPRTIYFPGDTDNKSDGNDFVKNNKQ